MKIKTNNDMIIEKFGENKWLSSCLKCFKHVEIYLRDKTVRDMFILYECKYMTLGLDNFIRCCVVVAVLENGKRMHMYAKTFEYRKSTYNRVIDAYYNMSYKYEYLRQTKWDLHQEMIAKQCKC